MTSKPPARMAKPLAITASSLLALQTQASVQNPSILPTPPMGFNNWARFECNLNQTLFTSTADAMQSNGLLAAGYNRLNLDDCWMQTSRAPNGSLQWNTTLFPDGLVWLGEYLHARGFHFGIYEDAGNATCGGYPGSRGYEELDAQTFEAWGIDYLKLDGCNVYPSTEQTYRQLYGKWHGILTGLEKPMIFSESAPAYFAGTDNNTDWYEVMDWVPRYGELARHSTDIAVYGLYQPKKYWQSIITNYNYQVLLARYQRPGYYNDPDFLIPDWPELTLAEKKSHFALWASFSAPLIISAYIPTLADEVVEYLTNPDIIAVDQDPLALQATLVSQTNAFDVLTKNLANGDRLLTVLNKSPHTATTTITASRMGLEQGRAYQIKDLFSGSTSTFTDSLTVELESHLTGIYRITPQRPATPTGMLFNTASRLCMTAHNTSHIAFEECEGRDEQVWHVTCGMLSPLSCPWSCLQVGENGTVGLGACTPREARARWRYHVSGNVVNAATGECLQEGGKRHIGKCGREEDGQVFGLPSGVEVIWDGGGM